MGDTLENGPHRSSNTWVDETARGGGFEVGTRENHT